MVILNPPHPGNLICKICLISFIQDTYPSFTSHLSESISTQHIQCLVNSLHTVITIITETEAATTTLLSTYLYYTRSTTRTVLGCFRSVL